MNISFHNEDISYQLPAKNFHKRWIHQYIRSHKKNPGPLAFIFTSNAHLKRMNEEYLNHNYFTDVISFDYSQDELVSGDIFISVDQVRENALEYHEEEAREMRRVMIHGVLHLLGFRDGSQEEKREMREMEDEALLLWLKMKEDESAV